jgi:2-keto-4-pentenoate hydratase/2-oxohepta-3-ene-1,7-dioic acid hydratase in catechol pathway
MKIICIGRNYAAHATELGNAIPDEPVVFMKPKNALLQTGAPFYYPDFCNELHYECEIVLRVCKNGRFVQPKHALDFVDGITVGIDFTARDIQDDLKAKGLPWEKAKAFDNSAVVGKMLPFTEKANPHFLFSMQKNGELVQSGDTKLMLFNFSSIICNISNYFSLNIGDLIFTGTPAGVGECVVGDVLDGFLANEKMFSVKVR